MGSFHGSLVGGGKAPLGIELSCTHHRSATDGLVTAVSTPLHVGRTICTFEIVISDEAGPADLHGAAHRAAQRPPLVARPPPVLIMQHRPANRAYRSETRTGSHDQRE